VGRAGSDSGDGKADIHDGSHDTKALREGRA
jgi:hypothetical protein